MSYTMFGPTSYVGPTKLIVQTKSHSNSRVKKNVKWSEELVQWEKIQLVSKDHKVKKKYSKYQLQRICLATGITFEVSFIILKITCSLSRLYFEVTR